MVSCGRPRATFDGPPPLMAASDPRGLGPVRVDVFSAAAVVTASRDPSGRHLRCRNDRRGDPSRENQRIPPKAFRAPGERKTSRDTTLIHGEAAAVTPSTLGTSKAPRPWGHGSAAKIAEVALVVSVTAFAPKTTQP